jgi:hypothetical protein
MALIQHIGTLLIDSVHDGTPDVAGPRQWVPFRSIYELAGDEAVSTAAAQRLRSTIRGAVFCAQLRRR